MDADDEPELADQDIWTLPHEVPRVWSPRPSFTIVVRWMVLYANLDDDEGCSECGGTGYSHHDCGEDSCCCLNPEDNVICDWCEGEG